MKKKVRKSQVAYSHILNNLNNFLISARYISVSATSKHPVFDLKLKHSQIRLSIAGKYLSECSDILRMLEFVDNLYDRNILELDDFAVFITDEMCEIEGNKRLKQSLEAGIRKVKQTSAVSSNLCKARLDDKERHVPFLLTQQAAVLGQNVASVADNTDWGSVFEDTKSSQEAAASDSANIANRSVIYFNYPATSWVEAFYYSGVHNHETSESPIHLDYIEFETVKVEATNDGVSMGVSLKNKKRKHDAHSSLLKICDKLIRALRQTDDFHVKTHALTLVGLIKHTDDPVLLSQVALKMSRYVHLIFQDELLNKEFSKDAFSYLDEALQICILEDDELVSYELIDELFNELERQKRQDKQELLLWTIAKYMRQSHSVAEEIGKRLTKQKYHKLLTNLKARGSRALSPKQYLGLLMIFGEMINYSFHSGSVDRINQVMHEEQLRTFLILLCKPVKNVTTVFRDRHIAYGYTLVQIHYLSALKSTVQSMMEALIDSAGEYSIHQLKGLRDPGLLACLRNITNCLMKDDDARMGLSPVIENLKYVILVLSTLEKECRNTREKRPVTFFRPEVKKNVRDNRMSSSDRLLVNEKLEEFILAIERHVHGWVVAATNTLSNKCNDQVPYRLNDDVIKRSLQGHSCLLKQIREVLSVYMLSEELDLANFESLKDDLMMLESKVETQFHQWNKKNKKSSLISSQNEKTIKREFEGIHESLSAIINAYTPALKVGV